MPEQPAPIDLRAEYLRSPLGIGTPAPRLSWALPPGDQRGRRQAAYQILASSSPENTGDLWDSGKVDTDQSTLVPYAGAPLESRRRVWWQVRVWDVDGEPTAYSASTDFEVGLLDADDWQARWILAGARKAIGEELTDADREIAAEREGRRYWRVPQFRKEFQITKPVRSARLYITARGLFDAGVNSVRVGADEFSPGWTDYHKRIQYRTFDIADRLVDGANAIAVTVGDGWYCGYVGFHGQRELYGVDPELLAQIEIDYVDGSRETIASDDTWRWSYGPITSADFLEGERRDARLDLGAWQSGGYDDAAWIPVRVNEEKAGAIPLVAQPDLPAIVTQELTPKSITVLGEGRHLVDMGQNMVGQNRLRVDGPAGTVVSLRHTEMLTADGQPYLDNLRAARQLDEYTLRGDGPKVYEPQFTFHGFRYVEVTGYPGELTPESLTGCVVESQTETAGMLETGHPMVNKLIENILWGQRGNFLSIPTDCPQRDERAGWMGDAQVFVRTAAYNRNVAPFFTKWLADVRDAQRDDNMYTDVCPSILLPGPGAPAWMDAGVICPWTIYLMYGDREILEASYKSMARYVDALADTNPDGIWRNGRNNDFGDWLSIEADTPKDVLATAYFGYDALLLSQIAGILGKVDDQKCYDELFTKIKTAFNGEFVDADGGIAGDTQTVYLLALKMSLLDPEKRPEAARRLVQAIEAKRGHLSTGFIGVSYLCPILTEFGYPEVAYSLLLNESYPSWGYSIAHGATTIWERWDGWTEHKGFQDAGMNSFNHYSLGSVGEWLYRSVAGIDIDVDVDHPGFKKFVMNPEPSRELGYAKATYQSPYGEIASYWRFDGDDWLWDVTVPANSSAVAYLPSTDADKIAESGLPLPLTPSPAKGGGNEGIDLPHPLLQRGEMADGRIAVTLAAGRYEFRVKK